MHSATMRFEYPFNERVRTVLRLESLLDRIHLLAQQSDSRMHQIALSSLFDMLDITDRADIKSAISQDLTRQRQTLAGYADHPTANVQAIEQIMLSIDDALEALNNLGRIGQAIRDNDWLVAIRGRLSIAGAAAQIDSPSLLAWQQRTEVQRRADLKQWLTSVEPLRCAIQLTLQLLRQSGEAASGSAAAGSYQRSLEGKSYHILQVWVDQEQGVYPEMSGNKHMMWVRFSRLDENLKIHSANQDVNFKYALCGL
jgi:cell division protein ZapD